ncbi:hypothetical protein HN51_008302 [Arachis hypogaea]|nr:Miraculin [Arachis hypogaea]
MKITLQALLSLFALCTRQIFFGGYDDDSPNQVLDTLGNKLREGENYYIIPVQATNNKFSIGTMILNCTFNADAVCPTLFFGVVDGIMNHGQPFSFSSIKPNKRGFVHVSRDLNIKFSSSWVQTSYCCNKRYSRVWEIGMFDRSTRKWFVTSGGSVGNPSWRSIKKWFKIEKYEKDYKIVYCPSFCEYCKVQCRDIGVYEDQNGNKRLALVDVPYKVQFQKA